MVHDSASVPQFSPFLVFQKVTMDQVNVRKEAINAIIGECQTLVQARAATNHLLVARHSPMRALALNEEKHRQQIQKLSDANTTGSGFERDYRDRLHRVAEEVTDELLAQSPVRKQHKSSSTTIMTGITQEV
jgi:hypothetical protein